jgi:hypothetical protein
VDAFSQRFSSVIQETLKTKIAEKNESFSRTKAPDYPTYCERVGFVKGLEDALARAKELETTLGRSEKTQGVVSIVRAGYET